MAANGEDPSGGGFDDGIGPLYPCRLLRCLFTVGTGDKEMPGDGDGLRRGDEKGRGWERNQARDPEVEPLCPGGAGGIRSDDQDRDAYRDVAE